MRIIGDEDTKTIAPGDNDRKDISNPSVLSSFLETLHQQPKGGMKLSSMTVELSWSIVISSAGQP